METSAVSAKTMWYRVFKPAEDNIHLRMGTVGNLLRSIFLVFGKSIIGDLLSCPWDFVMITNVPFFFSSDISHVLLFSC